MKNLIFSLAMFYVSISGANALEINQHYPTDFMWAVDENAAIVSKGLNHVLQSYGCVSTEMGTKILKNPKQPMFGKDQPGLVDLTYRTNCNDSRLQGLQFSAQLPWYDEDYGRMFYKIRVNGTEQVGSLCWHFNGDGSFLDCNKIFKDTPPKGWSSPVNQEIN